MFELPVPIEWIVIGIVGLIILVIVSFYVIPRILPVIAIALAVINDLLDLGLIGTVPITGDVLDIITSIVLAIGLRKIYTAISLAELIPGIDFLPIHTLSAILSLTIGKKKSIEISEKEEKYWNF